MDAALPSCGPLRDRPWVASYRALGEAPRRGSQITMAGIPRAADRRGNWIRVTRTRPVIGGEKRRKVRLVAASLPMRAGRVTAITAMTAIPVSALSRVPCRPAPVLNPTATSATPPRLPPRGARHARHALLTGRAGGSRRIKATFPSPFRTQGRSQRWGPPREAPFGGG